jgi:hypothetical protein
MTGSHLEPVAAVLLSLVAVFRGARNPALRVDPMVALRYE